MTRGRAITLAALVLAVFASLPGMALRADAAGAAKTLRISTWKLPFNLPVMWETESGAYAKSFGGMTVTEVSLQTGPKQMAAVAAGDLDVVQGLGDAAFLVAAAAGIDAKIVAVNSRSPKAFAVLAIDPSIRTAADLKGKKVAGLRGSVVHQVLIAALAEHGLRESDVEFYPMPVAQAAAALLAKRADAALLVGSEVVRVQKAGGRVLADGEGRLRGLSLVIAGAKFLRDNPDFAARFRKLRRVTLGRIEADRETAAALAAKETGMSPEEASGLMAWYDFDAAFSDEDMKSLESTQRYLLEQKMIAKPIDLAPLVWREN